jgi:hypothetical protein
VVATRRQEEEKCCGSFVISRKCRHGDDAARRRESDGAEDCDDVKDASNKRGPVSRRGGRVGASVSTPVSQNEDKDCGSNVAENDTIPSLCSSQVEIKEEVSDRTDSSPPESADHANSGDMENSKERKDFRKRRPLSITCDPTAEFVSPKGAAGGENGGNACSEESHGIYDC